MTDKHPETSKARMNVLSGEYRKTISLVLLLALLVNAVAPFAGGRAGGAERTSEERAAGSGGRERLAKLAAMQAEAAAATGDAKIRAYDDIVGAFRYDTDAKIQFAVVDALARRGNLTKDYAEAARFYDEAAAMARRGRYAGFKAQVVYAMNRKADRNPNVEEKIALFNLVLAEFGNASGGTLQTQVAYTMLYKAGALEDRDEAIALCDRIVDRFGEHETGRTYVVAALAMARKVSLIEDPVEKAAVRDALVAKFGDSKNFSIARAVSSQMMAKARSLPDVEAGAVYDDLLRRYMLHDDHVMQRRVADAMERRADLFKNDEQRYVFYEKILEVTEGRIPENRTLALLYKMSTIAPDAAIRLALLDRIIAAGAVDGADDSVLRALYDKAGLTTERAAKIALYDDLLRRGRNRSAPFALLYDAVSKRAELSGSVEEKVRIIDATLNAAEKDGGSADRALVNRLVDLKSDLLQDPSVKIRHYDTRIERSVDPSDKIAAMMAKASATPVPKDKVALYDQILAEFADAEDERVLVRVASALFAKAGLVEDKGEKLRLYDEVIGSERKFKHSFPVRHIVELAVSEKSRLTGDTDLLAEYYDGKIRSGKTLHETLAAMIDKAGALPDKSEKIRVYSSIIDIIEKKPEEKLRWYLYMAYSKKARLVEGVPEKIALYDTIIRMAAEDAAGVGPSDLFVYNAYETRTRLTGNKNEKKRFLDGVVAALGKAGKPRHAIVVVRALMEKAELQGDAEGRIAIYDEAYARYGDSVEEPVRDEISRALLAKADLVEKDADKLALLDLVLARCQDGDWFATMILMEQAVRAKVAVLDDPALVDAFYDDLLARTHEPSRRIKLALMRIDRHGDPVTAGKMYDALIAEYIDSPEPSIQGDIAHIVFMRAEIETDPAEKRRLFQIIADKFESGASENVLGWVVRAKERMIALTEDKNEKLRLYDELIAKYKNSDNVTVKMTVDRAVAARFRLRDGE